MKESFDKIISQIKNRIRKIFNSDLTAKQIAVNFTIGILIGLLVPMGLQTMAVIAICAAFKVNFVVVVFATLISNPFTVVFIYYSAFKIGKQFINLGVSWNQVSNVLNNPELEAILSLSLNSLKVIYTGLLIESIVFSVLSFIAVYYIAKYIRTKRKLKSSILSIK